MKNIIIIISIAILALVGFLFINAKDTDSDNNVNKAELTEQVDLTSPARPAEVNGTVQSVEGNIIVIANEVGKEQLTEEERDKRKEEMQDLSQEERQAMRQEELETIETEDTELTIPVGITITKGSGDSTGDAVLAEISELEKGIYLSIWLTESNTPEFVKIKGIGQ